MNAKNRLIRRSFRTQGSDDPVSSEALVRRHNSGAVHDVLTDRQLTVAEKRAILASWASNAHAVVDMPAMRRIGDGKVVKIDEILAALKYIDGDNCPRIGMSTASRRQPFARREQKVGIRRLIRIARRKNSDDDDPPPCPAAVSVPARPSMVDARASMPAWQPARLWAAPIAA